MFLSIKNSQIHLCKEDRGSLEDGWKEAGRGTRRGTMAEQRERGGGKSNPEIRGPEFGGLRMSRARKGGAAQDEPRDPNSNDSETDLRDAGAGMWEQPQGRVQK